MNVYVFGQRELVQQLERDYETTSHLISIGNPGKGVRETGEDSTIPQVFKDSYEAILRLEFFDAEYRHHLKNTRPKRIPRKRDVRKLIRFFQKTRNEATGYTVHCWQGISRSTAIALCILYMLLDDENLAVERLMVIRPEAVPHTRILEYFDQIMGSKLEESVAPIREKHYAEVKRWFFSEIEDGDALLAELEAVEDIE